MDVSPEDQKKTDKLAELFKEATLDPELEKYRCEIPGVGPCIKHPLVFAVPYFPMENNRLNMTLQFKKEKAQKALDEGQYALYIGLHERPYRIDAFDEVYNEISDDAEYWEILGEIWSDTENAFQNFDRWRFFWNDTRPSRTSLMSDEEMKKLDSMPEVIAVYRGFSHDGAENGLAWTIDQKKARWFALRFWREGSRKEMPRIASALVRKEDVLAYLTDRGEDEIVVDPDNVFEMKISKPIVRKV